MLNIKKHIPNFITSLNAACGFVAITFAFIGSYETAFYYIFLAAFFDFLDGGAARLLNVQSELGKQMDSLCDVISFGVAPGFILFSMMRDALFIDMPLSFENINTWNTVLLFSPLIVPVFSVIRLAKFNIDTRQTDSFIGLPVPANAIMIASLGALLTNIGPDWTPEYIITGLKNPYIILAIAAIQSYLLISPLPMFALKFKNLTWKDNKIRFSFIALAAALLAGCGVLGLALTISLYIITSLIIRLMQK